MSRAFTISSYRNALFSRPGPPADRVSRPFRPLLILFALLLLLPTLLRADSVILFVGDGTGLAQIAAARLAAVGPDGRLAVDELDRIAVVTTHSASGLTTDSAAGATAWATGRKTHNGFLAVDPDGRPLTTILERARDAGYATGLVTTTSLSHATPAAFAAHIDDRNAQTEIAAQMLATGPQVLFGGGHAYWIPQDEDGSKRDDDLDLLQQARQAGYQVVETGPQLRQLDPSRTRRVLGLFAPNHLPYEYDRTDGTSPTLSELTGFAIDLLRKNKKGFFLLVEGGRIDHACHSNDADRAIWEAIAFDRAVARGLEFARAQRHTLVLFVADHETGGMSVANQYYEGFPEIPRVDGFPDRSVDLGETLRIGWTTGGHTGIPVIAAAAGPGAEKIRGLLDNTDLHAIMLKTLGLKEERR